MIPLTQIWSPADVRETAELAARFLTEPGSAATLAPVVDIRTREVIA
jgi:beta-glucosidase-like glycosyl hydrolase